MDVEWSYPSPIAVRRSCSHWGSEAWRRRGGKGGGGIGSKWKGAERTGSGFSPTTRDKDYAISRELFHWESQSTTSEGRPTGMRYRRQASSGNRVVLFARKNEAERAFWCLGTASYVRHEGERPMAVTWRLHTPLPLDLFNQFAAVVA